MLAFVPSSLANAAAHAGSSEWRSHLYTATLETGGHVAASSGVVCSSGIACSEKEHFGCVDRLWKLALVTAATNYALGRHRKWIASRQRVSRSRVARFAAVRSRPDVMRVVGSPSEASEEEEEAASEQDEAVGGLGILRAVSDLPQTKALGIEIRAHAALAGPVSMLGGAFLEEPASVCYKLDDNSFQNQATLFDAVDELIKKFKWKGVVGSSVTKEVARALGIEAEGYVEIASEVSAEFTKRWKTRVSSFNTVMHTDAVGYNELVWGNSAKVSRWQDQEVAVCTVGLNLGAVLFSNGKLVEKSICQSNVCRVVPLGGDLPGECWQPSVPGTPEFEKWANAIDEQIHDIIATGTGLDRVIILPTGKATESKELPAALLDCLTKTREVAAAQNVKVRFMEQDAGSTARGAALLALVKVQETQMHKSLDTVLSGDITLQMLSDAQLKVMYENIVEKGETGTELCISDRQCFWIESFEDFMDWWKTEVRAARIVTITSAAAWNRILNVGRPPEGYGDLILLQVTFTFCRACKKFQPQLRRMAEKYNKVRFVQLIGNGTIGSMQLVQQELGVKVSPAFFVYRRGGELLTQWTGGTVAEFQVKFNTCLEEQGIPIDDAIRPVPIETATTNP